MLCPASGRGCWAACCRSSSDPASSFHQLRVLPPPVLQATFELAEEWGATDAERTFVFATGSYIRGKPDSGGVSRGWLHSRTGKCTYSPTVSYIPGEPDSGHRFGA